MIRTLFLALLAITVFAPVAQAKGLEVGAKIPALAAKDHTGKDQTFDSLKGTKGLTVVFIRSVEWCPFCQRQVMDLAENAAKFKDAGYPIVTVSYDAPEKLAAFHSKLKPGVTLLSDQRSEVIKSFGVLNENYAKGTMAYGTPFPGVFVVSADQSVKAKFFKEGVQDRPAVDELLSSMKEPVAAMDPVDEFPQETTAPVEPVMDGAAPVTDAVDTAVEPAQETLMPAEPVVDAVPPAAPEIPAAPDLTMPETSVPEAPAVDVPVAPEASAPTMPVMPTPEAPAIEFIPPTEDMPPVEDADAPADGTAPGGL